MKTLSLILVFAGLSCDRAFGSAQLYVLSRYSADDVRVEIQDGGFANSVVPSTGVAFGGGSNYAVPDSFNGRFVVNLSEWTSGDYLGQRVFDVGKDGVAEVVIAGTSTADARTFARVVVQGVATSALVVGIWWAFFAGLTVGVGLYLWKLSRVAFNESF
jgi:hypothetical protein